MQSKESAEQIADQLVERYEDVNKSDVSVRKASSNSEVEGLREGEYLIQAQREVPLDYNLMKDYVRIVDTTGASQMIVEPVGEGVAQITVW